MSARPADDVLYAGPDLHRAAAESRVRLTRADRLAGLRNACAVGAGMATGRLRGGGDRSFELVVAAGNEAAGPLAVYAGTGANRDWCLSSVFPGYRIRAHTETRTPSELAHALADAGKEADIVFTEGISRPALETAGAAHSGTPDPAGSPLTFAMPAWVKQRLSVVGDWPRQLAGLRRDTRQEVSRVLRKYGYTCHLSRDPADRADFYDRLYRPYVSRRFGEAALVVDRERFLADCRRGVLLRLARQDEVVGTALLRPLGRTLAVVWSALDPAGPSSRLRGASDVLDYFSLLYAHLRGARWLDLGPSRPDLFDGVLRYKAKWGAEVRPGLAPQAELRCSCRGSAAAGFLERHAFLVKAGGGLRGLFFCGADTDPGAFRAQVSAALTKGVRDYRVTAFAPPDRQLEGLVAGLDARIELVDGSRLFADAATQLPARESSTAKREDVSSSCR